jgi:branched-chain amino acid transport system permease protein
LPSGSESRRSGPDRRPIFRLAAIAVGAALILSFPAVAGNPYMVTVGIGILNYAVLATAWNFVGGFTGYISLGHGALSGLGAYGTALLVTVAGLPSFAALLIAAALVAVLAIPIGAAALRVRGASFVIVSIALVLILLLVFQSWESLTGGSRGLVVPRPFPALHRAEHHRVFFFLFAGLLAVALRPRPQGDPRGRGQVGGPRHPDVHVQAGRVRRVRGVHRPRRRPLRAVVR